MEEARKRDHRKLGKELDLFHFHQYSPGAAFWTPKGTILYNTLSAFMRKLTADNGYVAVTKPRPDDVAIHATGDRVLHTALVRAVLEDGTVLVESKWAGQGRFFHAVDDHPFGGTVTYYRSPRPGHVLRGLPGAGTSADDSAEWEPFADP